MSKRGFSGLLGEGFYKQQAGRGDLRANILANKQGTPEVTGTNAQTDCHCTRLVI